MRSEVVFVQAVGADVDAAIRLLTPGRPMPRQVVDNGIWTAVTVPPSSGRSLAAPLGQALDRTSFVLSMGPDGGTLTLFGRDGRLVGPVDGRDPRAVADLLTRWRFMRSDAVASALTSPAEPFDRIRQVAAAMRLPDPVAPVDAEHTGVLVVDRPAAALRSRLAATRQGVILLPLGRLTALVADGREPGADPVAIAESATAAGGELDRAVLVSWGAGLSVETWGGQPNAPPLAASAGEGSVSAERATAVLTELGLSDVPVGASGEALAAWALSRPAAVRLPAGTAGMPTALPVTDPAHVRSAVRHLRRLRRGQLVLGVVAVGAGAGMAVAWDEVSLVWVGLFAILLVVSFVLGVLVGRRRRSADPLPRRRRRRVPITAGNQVGRPQLPH